MPSRPHSRSSHSNLAPNLDLSDSFSLKGISAAKPLQTTASSDLANSFTMKAIPTPSKSILTAQKKDQNKAKSTQITSLPVVKEDLFFTDPTALLRPKRAQKYALEPNISKHDADRAAISTSS